MIELGIKETEKAWEEYTFFEEVVKLKQKIERENDEDRPEKKNQQLIERMGAQGIDKINDKYGIVLNTKSLIAFSDSETIIY